MYCDDKQIKYNLSKVEFWRILIIYLKCWYVLSMALLMWYNHNIIIYSLTFLVNVYV